MSSKRFFNKSIATALSLATLLTTTSPCTYAVNNSPAKKDTSGMSTAKKVAIGAGIAVVTVTALGIKYLYEPHQRNTEEVVVDNLSADNPEGKIYEDLFYKYVISDRNITFVRDTLNNNPNISINAQFGVHKKTLLHKAAQHGAHKMCELLINEFHADVNALANGNMTPLHIAASHGHIKCCDVLLYYGADPTLKESDDSAIPSQVAKNRIARCEETIELLKKAEVWWKQNHNML